jgi:hypothetical protein
LEVILLLFLLRFNFRVSADVKNLICGALLTQEGGGECARIIIEE